MNFRQSPNKFNCSSNPNLTSPSKRNNGERVTKAQRREDKIEMSREQQRENRIEAMISKTRIDQSQSSSLNRQARFGGQSRQASPKKVPYYLMDRQLTETKFNQVKSFNTRQGPGMVSSRVFRSPGVEKINMPPKKMVMRSPNPRLRYQNQNQEGLTTYQQLLKK